MNDLDLSEWIEMCLHFKSVKIYTGPHAEEFIDGVREYEERIRKLEAKLRKSALQELSVLGQEIEVTAELEQAEAKIVELEAKLEKAMEHVADYSNDPHLVEWANATLAELKGQDDE